MPPKRRAAATAVSSSKPAAKRRSKLAKENDITAEQEAEIKEAFSLFAVEHADFADEKEGVIARGDVRKCLIALGLSIDTAELPEILSTLDPDNIGFIPYEPFLAIAALHINNKESSPEAEDHHNEELAHAYSLFTNGAAGPITIQHLRRVARELKEDVSDDVLRDMILEANGHSGKDGVRRGVDKGDFEGVMNRAGVFG